MHDRRMILLTLAAAAIAGSAQADSKTNAVLKSLMGAKLTDKDAQDGLRQALTKGSDAAVTRVAKPDGYWGDNLIRIPLPKKLASVQKLMKPLGQSGVFDDLHMRMNRAAEAAAPVARGLFVDAITGMTIQDAVDIVKGGNTAGTEYLQKTTTPRLTDAFTPPMENALAQTGAVEYLDRAIKRNSLQGLIQTDPKTYLGKYAVGLALDGIFHYVGSEETAIRRDPAKRTTQILKTVFG